MFSSDQHPSIAAPTDPRVQKTVLGVAEYDFKLPVPRFKVTELKDEPKLCQNG